MYVETGIIQDKDILLMQPSECLFFMAVISILFIHLKTVDDQELADKYN